MSLSVAEIDRSQFSFNTQIYNNWRSRAGGGAIYATSSNIRIDRSLFTHSNAAGRNGGGAIYSSGLLQVNNTMFIYNRASYPYSDRISGGAIYAAGVNTSIIIGCQFINNTIRRGSGGGLYATGGSLTVSQCSTKWKWRRTMIHIWWQFNSHSMHFFKQCCKWKWRSNVWCITV